jgi:flagellar hook-length control protein FliK
MDKGASAASADKQVTGGATTAAIDAATSTPDASAAGATKGANAGASTYSGAAAQTANAAAVSAAAPAVVASGSATPGSIRGTDSSSSSDDDSPAPAGATPDGAVPAVAAMPSVVAPVSSPAAVASAQSVSALANIGPADKHSRSAAGDSSLPDTAGDAAGAAQLSSNTTTAADGAPATTMKVTPAVDTPEFAQGVADRVSLMVDNNLTSAKLQVNPPQLGPIDVRISVQGDQAQVSLTAHSAVTRDALESSASKLREMLGAQGFGQVSVDISQRSFQERSTHAQPYEWTPTAGTGASAASVTSLAASTPRASSSIVDAYA